MVSEVKFYAESHPAVRKIHNEKFLILLVSHYEKYENDLNFKGIEFPVKPNDVPKFERQNDVSVNSYVLKKKQRGKDKVYHEVSPFHVTNHRKELCEVIVDSRL